MPADERPDDRPDDRLSDAELDRVQRAAFTTFLHPPNEVGGLFRDRGRAGAPCSVACVGFALSCWAVGASRGWMTRGDALARTLRSLRRFAGDSDDPSPGATPAAVGHRGFYYHFLSMAPGESLGRRTWRSEASTVDTALLIAGALLAAAHFGGDDGDEREVRRLASLIESRADWAWAAGRSPTVVHGWRPETGRLRHRWRRFDESLLLYAIACGSPASPAPASAWPTVQTTHRLVTLRGREHLHAGPLFVHQYPHCWLDLRGLQDDFVRRAGFDYFENSRRATLLQRRFATDHGSDAANGFVGFAEDSWGFTACDGPARTRRGVVRRIRGRKVRFLGYAARGVPFGPTDGTLAPWSAAASYPFAPREVAAAVRHFERHCPPVPDGVGWRPTINPSFAVESDPGYWVQPDSSALHDGPIVLMLENARTGLPWRLMRSCPTVGNGLRRMGFAGGWL